VTDILTRLAAPFPPDRVSWRVGPTTQDKSKGQALAYIDARDVMERLDNVLGADGWQCEYVPMPNGTTCCRIGVNFAGHWVWKANGAGATDVEGEKGAYSDAMKRSAVLWGIGRYLYDLDCPWVELDDKKRIKPHEHGKLKAILGNVRQLSAAPTPPPLPKKDAREVYKALNAALLETDSVAAVDAFGPVNKDAINSLPPDWRATLKQDKDDRRAFFAAREQLKEAAE
jgi:hypothetical protein